MPKVTKKEVVGEQVQEEKKACSRKLRHTAYTITFVKNQVVYPHTENYEQIKQQLRDFMDGYFTEKTMEKIIRGKSAGFDLENDIKEIGFEWTIGYNPDSKMKYLHTHAKLHIQHYSALDVDTRAIKEAFDSKIKNGRFFMRRIQDHKQNLEDYLDKNALEELEARDQMGVAEE